MSSHPAANPRSPHEAAERRRELIHHFTSGGAVVIGLALLSLILHHSSILQDMQFTNLDVFFFSQKKLPDADHIVMVPIGSEEFDDTKTFRRHQPLDPKEVARIVAAVAASGPSVIGVDIVTEEWTASDRDLVRTLIAQDNAAAVSTPIVWIASGPIDESTGKVNVQHLNGLAGFDCVGLPAIVPDSHYVVRQYWPSIDVILDGRTVPFPSLSALLNSIDESKKANCQLAQEASPAHEGGPELVNFSGGSAGFAHFPARVVLDAPKNDDWKKQNPLKGKIVLIGGSFPEARDRYPTPAGTMDGVEILGESTLTARHRVRQTGAFLFLFADIFVGFLLLTATAFRRVWVPLLSFIVIPLAAMIASFIAFSRFGYFISFIPVMMGVFLHNLVEHAQEDARMKTENRQYHAGKT